jgi:hypothetical protein
MSPIDETTAPTGGAAGTDAERRAAVQLRDRLISLGRDAALQPVGVRPRFGLTHAIHALVAIVGSVVAAGSPALGAALVGAAALSAFLDVSGLLHVARRLTGSRASQNVESLEDAGKPGTLVVVAGYDAPRASQAFERAQRVLRDPWLAMVAAMLVILACCVLRLAGIENQLVTAVQFVPTVLLILLTAALADIELTEPAEAAPRSGAVATALRLRDELELENFDVWLVLAGAEQPFALGMGGWLRARRKQLDPEATAVLHVDSVGDGPVRYTRRIGPLVPLRCHRDLVRLCGEIAEDDGEDGVYAAGARVDRRPTNAAAAIARGLPAISVGCEGGGAPSAEALDRAYGFCAEFARRLDAEVGPALRGNTA